jgi:Tfp pilus assembly protein PilP
MTPSPRSLLLLLSLALTLTLTLGACGSDPTPAPPSAPAASRPAAGPRGARGKGQKKTLEQLKAEIARKSPLSASIFSPISERARSPLAETRNPFYGFIDIRINEMQRQRELEAAQKAASQDTTQPIKLEPLQLFDLRQLKLVATITNTPIPQANIIDPTREQHIIQVGSSIGPQGGSVVDIRENEVKIVRSQRQKDGTDITSCTIMRLAVSLDALVQATREADGSIDPLPPENPPCEVLRFYPKSLDNIKISYQD